MRNSWILVLFAIGCTPIGILRDSNVEDPQEVPEQIRKARRIVVKYFASSLREGSWTIWVLDADGKCRCETWSRGKVAMSLSGKEPPTARSYEVPSATFVEVQHLLMESRIWTVKDRSRQTFEFAAGFTVEWDGQMHSFSGYYPEESKRLVAYLDGLLAQAAPGESAFEQPADSRPGSPSR
jgi:hypothetical protein